MPLSELSEELERLRYMMQQHLQSRALTAPPVITGRHLDEDMLAVFVEGHLSEGEGRPMVTHLVACSACRNSTAQLIRLADEVEPDTTWAALEPMAEPSVFRRFFADLQQRVVNIGYDSDSVFAYHETDAPNSEEKPEENQKEH